MKAPRNAYNFPHLPDDVFVIWHWNGKPWQAADIEVSYLSRNRKHILKEWALWTIFPVEAAYFATKTEAEAWLDEQEEMRGHPYHGARITTVAEIKKEVYGWTS